MMFGGSVPGGRLRSIDAEFDAAWATARLMSAPGGKKTLMTETPASDCDSMCSMSSTSVVSERSYGVVIRCAMSWAEKPLYDQTTLTTGMLMFGKISVGVRMIARGPRGKKTTATTITGKV